MLPAPRPCSRMSTRPPSITCRGQLAWIGKDRPQVTGQGGDQLDVLAEGPVQQLLHRGNDAVKVEDLRPDHLPAGEGEQLAGEARRPFGGQGDLPEVAAD